MRDAVAHAQRAVHRHARHPAERAGHVGRGQPFPALHPLAAGRFIDEVDGLVGKAPEGQIALGQRHGGADGPVGDLQPVEALVFAADAGEDAAALGGRRLADRHRLEPPLERRVGLDAGAVFLRRRRADDADFAARQRRLENVRRVDRALGAARADDGVQLVDEQEDVAVLAALVDDFFQFVLELAAVFRTRDQRRDAERIDALAEQILRHAPLHDARGQPLDDGGLAHARLADEDGVVLGFPQKNADDAVQLGLAADERLDASLLRPRGQVDAVALDGGRAPPPLGAAHFGRGGAVGRVVREHALQTGVQPFDVRPLGLDDAAAVAVLAQHRHQQMLAADEAVSLAPAAHRGIQQQLFAQRRHIVRRQHAAFAHPQQRDQPPAHAVAGDALAPEHAHRGAFAVERDGQQNMLAADVRMPQFSGRARSVGKHASGVFRKAVSHRCSSFQSKRIHTVRYDFSEQIVKKHFPSSTKHAIMQ